MTTKTSAPRVFNTLADAIAAGYRSPVGLRDDRVRVKRRTGFGGLPLDGQCELIERIRDDSQYHRGARDGRVLGTTVTVRLDDELNRLGRPGAVADLFPPEVVAEWEALPMEPWR